MIKLFRFPAILITTLILFVMLECSVDHKNLQLDLYLDLIQYNIHEKIGILPYIQQNKEGIYLEIGTGGDPIADMMSQIYPDYNVTIIASDIEENVLNSLPQRHPELQKYIQAKQGPKLELLQLNAVKMTIFPNSFLNGINASSVLHEIISYAGGFKAMDQFFKEAFRVLKPDGVLVYRDPEHVDNPKAPTCITLKTKAIKLFTHIFLYKFFDMQASTLAKNKQKIQMYDSQKISFTFYKKNEVNPITLSYEQYLNIPSYDIDFERKYKLITPKGLYREIARHYLTYLHQCNPLLFIRCTPDITSDHYFVNYLAHSANHLFKLFGAKKNWDWNGQYISLTQKQELDKEIRNKFNALEFGIPLRFSSKRKQRALRTLLKKHNFDSTHFIIDTNQNYCLLDYRIFGMLYNEIKENIFDTFNGPVNNNDEEHAKWLKREGEEYYFYYPADQIIAQVLELTYFANDPCQTNPLVLCPLSKEHNIYLSRLCYTELLQNSIAACDDMNYPIEVKDGKRIIHFKKMPIMQALDICDEIISSNPLHYPKLSEITAKLKKVNLSAKGALHE